jgi:hypothetical protein
MSKQSPQKPGFWHVMLSTLAAAFGVQNRKNHEQDFNHGNIYIYIGAGLIFTVLFIITVFLVVKLVLSQAGV